MNYKIPIVYSKCEIAKDTVVLVSEDRLLLGQEKIREEQ